MSRPLTQDLENWLLCLETLYVDKVNKELNILLEHTCRLAWVIMRNMFCRYNPFQGHIHLPLEIRDSEMIQSPFVRFLKEHTSVCW